MNQIVWKDLSVFKKFIFSIGWLSILDLLFWIVVLIVYSNNKGENFWKKHGFKVIYIFGWINLISILFVVLLILFGPSPKALSY